MRRGHLLLAAVAAAGLLALETPAAQADGWVGSWGASIVFPVGPDVHAYQTLRQFVRLSVGGPRLRVRVSNATGVYPLVIGAAHIAKPAADGAKGAIDPASDHKLTFGGAREVTVPPGAEALSDPVEMDLPALSTVAISLFVPRWTGPSVIHLDGVTTTYISNNGDATAEQPCPVRLPPASATSSMKWTSKLPVSRARWSRSATPSPTAISRPSTPTTAGPTGWRSGLRPVRTPTRSA
jgi:hypothetical protein